MTLRSTKQLSEATHTVSYTKTSTGLKLRSAKQLSEAAYDAIKTILEDYRGPRQVLGQAVTQAVLIALTDELLIAQIRPFKSPDLSEAHLDDFFEVYVFAGGKDRHGYLRRIKTTVKRKGKKVTFYYYLDAQGLEIPARIAEDFMF